MHVEAFALMDCCDVCDHELVWDIDLENHESVDGDQGFAGSLISCDLHLAEKLCAKYCPRYIS